VALELTHLGEERIQEGTLESVLRSDLGVDADFPIFIPAATYTKGSRLITVLLMEGYAFLASGLEETKYFELERRPYVSQVMSTQSGTHRFRTLTTVPNKTVEDLRLRLREMVTLNLEVGDQVKAVEGTYRNLVGTVQDVTPEHAYVSFQLRSIELVAAIPRMFLELAESTII